jgi:hypothetical protein
MKKTWISPELTVHGDVEKITQQDKKFGANDGLTFLGEPIGNNS